MSEVEIYTSPFCGHCRRAKHLLESRGIAYTEIDVIMDPSARAEMTARAGGRRTVPQIFVGETHVGGADDLCALDRAGRLESLLVARWD